MGFPGFMMLFIAAITIAVALNHLFLAVRIRNPHLHVSIFLAGLSGFCYMMLVFTGYTSSPEVGLLVKIYRYQVLFLQASLLALVWSFGILYGPFIKKWMIAMLVTFSLFILATLLMPARLMFTEDPSATMDVIFGSHLTLLGDGVIHWRIFVDISVLFGIFYGVAIVIRKMILQPSNKYYLLLVSTGILLVSTVLDHLADAGNIRTIYFLPIGFFICFGIASSSSLQYMINDLRKSREMLMEDRKWRLMVNDMKLLIVELNTLGQIKYVNPFVLELTGYRDEEILGKDWFELLLPQRFAYDVQSAFIEILTNDFHQHYENPIITKYQEEKVISWYNVRLRDTKGKITGSVSIGIDITDVIGEKEKLESSLREALDTIEELKKGKQG